MVVLGLVLILLGAIAILSAVFVSEPGTGGELLGFEVTTLESFIVGVIAGALILWGFTLTKWGTRRSLAHRRERKELNKLNERIVKVEERRAADPAAPADGVTDRTGHPTTDPPAPPR